MNQPPYPPVGPEQQYAVNQGGVMGPPAPPGQQQAVRPPANQMPIRQPLGPPPGMSPQQPPPQMQHPGQPGMAPAPHMPPAPHQMPPGQYRQPMHPSEQRMPAPGPPVNQLPPPQQQLGPMNQQPPAPMTPMQHMGQQQGQQMPRGPPLGPPAGYGMNPQQPPPQQPHHQPQMTPHPGPPGSAPYSVPPVRLMGPPPPPAGHAPSPMSRPPRPQQGMGPGPGMSPGPGMAGPGPGMQQRPVMGPMSAPRGPMPGQMQSGGYPHHPGMGPTGISAGPVIDRSIGPPKKKKKLADKILPQKVRDLVPESQAYMDLLSFERKLDFTITRKRLDIQEALKRPMKHKRKLRVFISNTFFPPKTDALDGSGEGAVPSWELRVEGRLIDDAAAPRVDQSKGKRKFSSFFKSLVIELDQEIYGPDNHLVEWHRTANTTETDGFQVKRPGDKNVKCTILLMLDYQPHQYRLDARLARLLGIHTQTRPVIINALWQYMKSHKLQDPHEREFVNLDKYLEQIFGTPRLKFAEIPSRLNSLIHPPDPIQINHLITVSPATPGAELKKTSCYDIDVEIEDPLKSHMNNFVMSSMNQQEITQLDNKIHETVDTINQLKTNREFFLSFCKDPQQFIVKWLMSQNRDLKVMTDVAGNPEEERRSDFFYQPWTQEGVCRYFYSKVQLRRAEIEQALGIRNA